MDTLSKYSHCTAQLCVLIEFDVQYGANPVDALLWGTMPQMYLEKCTAPCR